MWVGIVLASSGIVAYETSASMAPLATIMWRMERADGMRAHASMGVHGDTAAVTWFVNERPVGTKTFADWTDALRWCDQLEAQNWSIGWRRVLEPEDERPSSRRS